MDFGSLLGSDVERDIALVRCCALTGSVTISVIVAVELLPGPVLIEPLRFSCSARGLVSLGPVLTPLVTLRFFTLVPRRLACTRYFKPAKPRVWPRANRQLDLFATSPNGEHAAVRRGGSGRESPSNCGGSPGISGVALSGRPSSQTW
jgi:hypothetical protein